MSRVRNQLEMGDPGQLRDLSPIRRVTNQEVDLAEVVMGMTESDTGTSRNGENIVSVEQGYKDRDYFSGKISDISRQLAFAGIGIIWVFKTGTESQQTVPWNLVPAGFLLVLGLSSDFLHHLVGTALWHVYTKRAHEAGLEEFVAPSWINRPTWALFVAKIVAIGAAYVCLIIFLTIRLVKRT